MFSKRLLCFKTFYKCNIVTVRHSALFINSLKASESFVYVTPHIEIPEILQKKDVIMSELLKRQSSFDFNKFENLAIVYMQLKQKKQDLEDKKSSLSKVLSKLMKEDPKNEALEKNKIHFDLVKENINKVKGPLWSLEESVMVEALKVPNSIHKLTPAEKSEIIHSYLKPPNNNKVHLEIGKKENLLVFRKNENYYLKGDAALFELGAKFYFSNYLKQNGFIQFSNPDFVKSLIVEGCGGEHTNPDSTFILHDNEDSKVNNDSRLHLTGGGSLASFMAYYTKNVLYSKVLPLKYFSMGRQYCPSDAIEDNLFHVSQSSTVQVFGVTKSSEEADKFLQETISHLKLIYSAFDVHFQIKYVSAKKLAAWESLRLSIEMYSSSLKKYIEVGNISLCGDYISKRLLFTYTENKESKFPHIISGTILNVPRFLGCYLEQDKDFVIPEQFKTYNWIL